MRLHTALFFLITLAAASTSACRSGSADDASSDAADTSATPIHCTVEYQAMSGTGAAGDSALVAQGDGTVASGIDAKSASAPYALEVRASGGSGISVDAALLGPSGLVAYTALSSAAFVPGAYAFEIGAPIPTAHATGYDGQPHDYDGVRAYCSVSAATPPPDPKTPTALDPKYFDPSLPTETVFHRQNPDPAKVDVAKLDALLAQAAAQGSDAVVIAQDDVIIAEKYFGKGAQVAPVMSVTKSVTDLAVGALIDEGKISSADARVSTWFPEWATGPKSGVTLRHLLTMTSGIQDPADLWDHTDLLAYARSLPLSTAPGAAYSYSNASTTLFAGIVASAAGMPADQYVKAKLFGPLGIADAVWAPDGAGNVQTAGGLSMTPLDLLRLGSLVAHGGSWNGASLVSASWLAQSTANQTPLEACYGFLWWLVRPGCDGYHFGASSTTAPVEGSFMDGWGGNYVAVVPSGHLVAIRTRYPGANATVDDEVKTRYFGFTQDVAGLAAH